MVVDALVVGGGPAGSTAARLLASWGWTVVLAHRDRPPRHSLAESLPPSTRKVLALIDQLAPVEAAGFHPNHGNIGSWAGESRTAITATAGFHVSRAAFDQLLRQSARHAGVEVLDAAVQRVDVADPIRIETTSPDGTSTAYRARFVLDCSGRAGVIARRGLRRVETKYRTLAVAAEWETDSWPAGERTHTLVESYPDGWAWSVPLSARRRQCTVMIDPARRSGRSPLLPTYERELAKAREISRRLAGARHVGRPWACDASVYDAVRAADAGVLLVGDAASFIEPLSSAGVKKALTSGWRAAVVTNTCLRDAAMTSAAFDLYTRRERRMYAECRRRSAAFFDEAARVYGHPFWTTRAVEAADPDDQADEMSDADLGRDPAVRAALEQLRAMPLLQLRLAGAVRFAPAPAIEGREVVLREALVLPGVEVPMRFAAGVNLPALVRLAPRCSEIPVLFSEYQRQIGQVPITALLAGLSWLVSRRALTAL